MNWRFDMAVEFQEAYKSLDKLCRECLSAREGVSEYIRQMEQTPYVVRGHFVGWDTTYKALKHVRWVRNQLAHEVGAVEAEVCSEDDIIFVRNFYQDILTQRDPLAAVYKDRNITIKDDEISRFNPNYIPPSEPKTLPLGQRLKILVRRLFGRK